MSDLMSLKSSDMQKMGFKAITGAHLTKSCPGFTACPESGSLATMIFIYCVTAFLGRQFLQRLQKSDMSPRASINRKTTRRTTPRRSAGASTTRRSPARFSR